jgi:signal peptidase II
MGLVVGGALGNILDRIFMGLIGGYGGIFDGHVVDFIHFTLEIADRPVFPYIFNVADIAISVSIILMLLFHKTILPDVNEGEGDGGPVNGSEGEGAPVNGSEGELVDGK